MNLELFGKRLLIVDDGDAHASNCTSCALYDYCTKATGVPAICEDAKGNKTRHFVELTMKVFGCGVQCSYGGGGILVAATSKEEAFLTAATDSYTRWLFEWIDDNGHTCEPDSNIAHLRCGYYPFEAWTEYPNLATNAEMPTVLLENGYVE